MPHINDLTTGVVWEGNNGDKWVVAEGIHSEKEIMPKLVKMEVETIINEPLQKVLKD